MAFDPFQLDVRHASLDVVLTAAKHSDGPSVIRALNDPRVHLNLDRPPFPYTEDDWESWFKHVRDINETSRQEWQAMVAEDQDNERSRRRTRWIGSKAWSSTIRVRDVRSDAPLANDKTEVMIGSIDVHRSGFPGILDGQEQEAAVARNNSLAAGDPRIVWEIGFYLTAEYHGRGIMPAVVQTLRDKVLVDLMNVHTLVGTYFHGNDASRRVFEKCGFEFQAMLPGRILLPDSKARETGNRIGLGIMRWTRAGASKSGISDDQSI